uniref:Uncharacterized protein n=1 Tax=Ramularia collo-cygni TaxID=112498 RepID=A0A2D3UY59_9PEZI
MQFSGLALTALLAFTASALPSINQDTSSLSARGVDEFKIHVVNKCKWTKQFALYQITGDFQMLEKSTPVNIPTGGTKTIMADFHAIGMRLSGHAEWGTARQWEHNALFEFGHSEYMGVQGTAYNLSLMKGSDADIGIRVFPIANGRGSGTCQVKTCAPWNCPAAQGWTDPDQINVGSPADTVCYHGKTDFRVVFCPDM